MKYIKGINEIPTHGHGFFKILFYKKFEKMEIQNWELIDKLFLTISIDYSELDALLRAQNKLYILASKSNEALAGYDSDLDKEKSRFSHIWAKF